MINSYLNLIMKSHISKVEGILDSIKDRFIISDIDKSRVISLIKININLKIFVHLEDLVNLK